ncbi:hypothetical protein L6164_032523 [Bauhinia variegata]|uniref:Uncharacterized protein n=1 Tax=Bauhinia variegata TaxID=167791 RepID=A0ACB9KPB8_BAUVA|nr:hypothetical protein L6164_032523 [Bauhinia variegata]
MCAKNYEEQHAGCTLVARTNLLDSDTLELQGWFSWKMAKGSGGRRRIGSRQYRPTPYPVPHCKGDICDNLCPKRCSKASDRKDWEDVTCSVCMEYPHKAVLILCSSHDKGCRPYMCGTSLRHSNCLDQYKKAYTKVISSNNRQPMEDSINNPSVLPNSNSTLEKCEVTELACPLCRGLVKGWTVVEPARDYLNAKKRSCMQDDCSFVGNYKELRKHVRAEHPSARPRAVDPSHEQKWRWLEWEREREDVISTITSTMPGAMVFGDYVIEGNRNDFDTDEEGGGLDADAAERNGGFRMGLEAMNFFLLFHAVRQGNDLTSRMRPELPSHRISAQNGGLDSSDQEDDDDNVSDRYSDQDNDGSVSLARRRRRREANTGRR